jgi:hypothetical protein
MYALIDISNQMLEDSAFDMEGEIRGEATEQFAVKEGAGQSSGDHDTGLTILPRRADLRRAERLLHSSGARSMTRKYARVEPSGCRRPCSHRRRVPTLNPNRGRELLLGHAELRPDRAHVDLGRDVHAVAVRVGLAPGVGHRLLQAAADAVGDLGHHSSRNPRHIAIPTCHLGFAELLASRRVVSASL